MSSCKSQSKASVDSNNIDGLKLILKGDYSGLELEKTWVIKNSVDLEQFFGVLNRTSKPGLSIPNIDFEREHILVRLKGISTNNAPDIKSIKNLGDTIVLKMKKLESLKQEGALLTPFFIYSVSKQIQGIKIQ